ncbi:MAG: LytR C-terminal domain-containing protein, partial [Tetrasphaera jenkinsii]|nr:LytR C-terminal domain-containing protein [Tetrasphaera jenkinsii]
MCPNRLKDVGTGIRMAGTNEESASRTFRARQWRRAAILVTLPGLVLGTGSIAAAFGVGLFDHSDKPACTPEHVPAPARSSFQLAVANAGETSGEATSVGRELTKRGFAVANVGNAPEGVYIKRAAMVYHGPEGLDQALLVASQIPGSRVYNDGRAGTSVEAVLGYGFKGLVK